MRRNCSPAELSEWPPRRSPRDRRRRAPDVARDRRLGRRCDDRARPRRRAPSRTRSAFVEWVGREVAPLVGDMSDARLRDGRSTRAPRARARSCSTTRASSPAPGSASTQQHFPRAGWVEHDAAEIRDNVIAVMAEALDAAGASAADVAAIGITNQRETAVIWDRATGEPISPAIVWQDTRTQDLVDRLAADGGPGRFREQTGLPLATYFSATKIAWILDNVDGARARAEAGELAFGTTDSWVLWNLTGGTDGGVHATDVTNASRTLLMDLRTPRLGRRPARGVRHPARAAPRDPQLVRGLRRGGRLHSPARRADRRHPGRPAGGDVRPGGVRRRRVEEHLRHGKLPHLQHRHRDHPLAERPDHDRRVPPRRRRSGLRARGLDRRDRIAHPVAARQPRHHREGARMSSSWRSRSTTTAACTSCRRSRGSSRRTGARTPAASSSASPASRTRATSPARRSRRPRSRPARCSMR